MNNSGQDNVLDSDVKRGLGFITESIRGREPVTELGVAPTRKKKVDSQGNLLKGVRPRHDKGELFGKPLPGTVQEEEKVEKAARHPLGFAYGMRLAR